MSRGSTAVREIIFVFAMLIAMAAHAQNKGVASGFFSDRFLGFERISFKIHGHDAWFAKPARPLKGNPWVWRTSFPAWHTEMDSILLSRGFWLFFVHVDDKYASPYAMQVYDHCYNYLVNEQSFSPKPALEAVSRGGLYAYGWAKRNPDKVSCIYAETPVCDIKSWPGGKGTGKGDPASWTQCLQVLGLTEETALTYRDIPLNELDGMAGFKIPLLHVISNNDSIVPPDENTYPLIKNYTVLGGPATIYPVTDGPQTLSGHHIPINRAPEWADFIEANTYPVKKQLSNNNYLHIRNGLSSTYNTITNKKKVTVAFLGGSITYGKGWRDKTAAYLQESFPETVFHFINAGIPSLGSLPHAYRLSTDLPGLAAVDLLFVEAAVNDQANGTDSSTQVKSLEGIVRMAKKANANMDIIFMSFADPDKNTDYDNGNIPAEIINHEKVADWYYLPSINLAALVHDKIANKEFTWAYDFKDLHPSAFGQELYFSAIKSLLYKCLIDSVSTTQKYILPEKRLNNNSFDNASYYELKQAENKSGWTFIYNWQPADGLATREGFTNVPVWEAAIPGATLRVPFKGRAIGISVISGADAGVIEYSTDGRPFKKLDLYTQWSSQLHLPWYLLLEDDLTSENHVLTLRISKDQHKNSRGHACRIVHFLVNK